MKYTKETRPIEVTECDCSKCAKDECNHRNAYRRLPSIIGGLGMCPHLAKEDK
jgi:hypothetical protein